MIEEKEEPFQNIQKNLNPTLIIHGKKDKLVDYKQAQMLRETCKSDCKIIYFENMGHEIGYLASHITGPMQVFGRKRHLI